MTNSGMQKAIHLYVLLKWMTRLVPDNSKLLLAASGAESLLSPDLGCGVFTSGFYTWVFDPHLLFLTRETWRLKFILFAWGQ